MIPNVKWIYLQFIYGKKSTEDWEDQLKIICSYAFLNPLYFKKQPDITDWENVITSSVEWYRITECHCKEKANNKPVRSATQENIEKKTIKCKSVRILIVCIS